MAQMTKSESAVRILLETAEDVWFWERRFNVFDYLEFFPADAITEAVPETHVPPPVADPRQGAAVMLTIETDAGFSFQTDIVRGGYYLRNQTQGTRRWMASRGMKPGDTILITRMGESTYRLSKQSVS